MGIPTHCPAVPVSLCPTAPVTWCPSVPMFQCPGVQASWCPSILVPQQPGVPASLCPSVPVTWGVRMKPMNRGDEQNAQTGGGRMKCTNIVPLSRCLSFPVSWSQSPGGREKRTNHATEASVIYDVMLRDSYSHRR